MMRMLLVAGLVCLLASCGKNDPIAPIGSLPYAYPPNQAPPPPGYQYPSGPPSGYQSPPPGGYTPGGFGGPGYQQPPPMYFNPQMPPQQPFPQAAYPFLPIYQYMQQTQYLQQQWAQLWQAWQQFAQMRGRSQYDFNSFWFDYCPQQWQNTQYAQVYNYMDQNFYYWASPQTQWQSYQGSSDNFWQNCSYYPYPEYDWSYNGCDSGCY